MTELCLSGRKMMILLCLKGNWSWQSCACLCSTGRKMMRLMCLCVHRNMNVIIPPHPTPPHPWQSCACLCSTGKKMMRLMCLCVHRNMNVIIPPHPTPPHPPHPPHPPTPPTHTPKGNWSWQSCACLGERWWYCCACVCIGTWTLSSHPTPCDSFLLRVYTMLSCMLTCFTWSHNSYLSCALRMAQD